MKAMEVGLIIGKFTINFIKFEEELRNSFI